MHVCAIDLPFNRSSEYNFTKRLSECPFTYSVSLFHANCNVKNNEETFYS